MFAFKFGNNWKTILFFVLALFIYFIGPLVYLVMSSTAYYCVLNLLRVPENSTAPIIKTSEGYVQGISAYARNGNVYFQYLALPYAKPPLEELRFEPPVALEQCWNGVRNSTVFPLECVQLDTIVKGTVVGVEDCLFLNVFTNDPSPPILKPVLVFIHGGGYLSGSSKMYNPLFILENDDIILVTLNYRLGPMGFASTGDDIMKANNGLKDQVLALKWIQANINQFGGDASKVTLFGESAGGASVHFHVLSSASSGLFSKAIIQSGSAFSPWTFTLNAKSTIKYYAQQLGCKSESSVDLKQCLKLVNAEAIVGLQKPLLNPLNGFLHFIPTKEKNSTGNFLCEDPQQFWSKKKVANKVPLMFGFNSDEGLLISAKLFTIPNLHQEIRRNWESHAPNLLLLNSTKLDKHTIKKIQLSYFGESISEIFPKFQRNFTDLMSDRYFIDGIRRSVIYHANRGQPIFLYYYNFTSTYQPSSFQIFKWINWHWVVPVAISYIFGKDKNIGSAHGDDLYQTWNLESFSGMLAADDQAFSRRFIRSFIDFAKNENNVTVDGVKWTPVKNHQNHNDPLSCMLFANSKSRMMNAPFSSRISIWHDLM